MNEEISKYPATSKKLFCREWRCNRDTTWSCIFLRLGLHVTSRKQNMCRFFQFIAVKE